MKICEQCYTSVYSKEAKRCPYCSAPFPKPVGSAEGYEIPKAPAIKIILQFSLIAAGLMLSIVALDFIANNNIGTRIGGCAGDEACFLTALAICQVDVDVRPSSYGLLNAKIVDKRDTGCYVEVQAMEYSVVEEKDVQRTKYCYFQNNQITSASMGDLFFCSHDENAELLYSDLSDEELVERTIGRGVPEELEEEI